MKRLIIMAGVALAAMAISSCDEDTLSIGNTLTNESDVLQVTPSTFYATTRTVTADSVLSLATNCYFGKVKDPETETEVKSEFSTQFHVLEDMYVSPEDSLGSHDANGRAYADSCNLVLYLTSPFRAADSLTAMKMRVRELDAPVESGQKYYSNFDPTAKGLIRQADGCINVSHVFTYCNQTDLDSARSSSTYLNNILIPLNQPYKAKDGTEYRNYGTYLLRNYFDHPEYFSSSYEFAHHLCPGFFFEITDGLGFHAKVSNIGLRVYYDVVRPDTAYRGAITLAGTKEVLQTTKVTNDQAAISELASESGHTYLKTPAGLFTEVTLPVDDIKEGHTADSLLAAKISFLRLNNESTDQRMLGIPQSILMVQKDSLSSFFENQKVPDGRTSFYTTYNSTYNTYTFTNISNIITQMWRQKTQGLATDPNWTANHPNWNKVLLVPITYSTSSSTSTLTNLEHDMSLTSTRLVGGADSPIEISVVYGKFNE